MKKLLLFLGLVLLMLTSIVNAVILENDVRFEQQGVGNCFFTIQNAGVQNSSSDIITSGIVSTYPSIYINDINYTKQLLCTGVQSSRTTWTALNVSENKYSNIDINSFTLATTNYKIDINGTDYIFLYDNAVIDIYEDGDIIPITTSTNAKQLQFILTTAILNITAQGFNQTVINEFQATVRINNLSYEYTYATTNGSILIPALEDYSYTITGVKSGYITIPITQTLNTTNNITLELYNHAQVTVKDINGNIINQQINISLEDTVNQIKYIFPNGIGNFTDLVANTEYLIKFYSAGYEDGIYSYTYNSDLPLTLYLFQTTTPITLTVQDTGGLRLTDALITIQTYINGTLTTVTSQLTDGTGIAQFNLIEGQTYFVSVTKDQYTALSFQTQVTQTTYLLTMESFLLVSFNGLDTSNIVFDYTPKSANVTPSNTTFTFTVTPSDVTLDYFNISLFTKNGTLIQTQSSTTSTGGTVSITPDLLAYNGSTVWLYMTIKKADHDEATSVVGYYVSDPKVIGTLQDMSNWIIANTTLADRIILWFFIVICIAIMTTVFIRGMLNVVLTSAIALLLTPIFGLNVFIVGTVITIIGILIFSRGGVQ